MALTGAHVQRALASVGAVGGQMTSMSNIAAGANDALRRAPKGLTKEGAAAFLATMAQESAYFRTTTEYSAGHNRYSPYDGRTFEMITWSANYGGFGKWCVGQGLLTDPRYFVKNPKALADFKWAWDGGVWFFQQNGLWRYANTGNFLAVSQGVNGGNGTIGSSWRPSGWKVRNTMYHAFLALGNALLPAGGSTGGITPVAHADTGQDLAIESSVADLKKLQVILGFTGKDVDGIPGPKTVKALEVLAGYKSVADGKLPPSGSATLMKIQARINQQMKNLNPKLVVDGIWGPASAFAFHDYLQAGGKLTDLAKQKLPSKAAAPKPKTTAFPLPKGHAYAMNNGKVQTHSGISAKDRPNITRIQKKVGGIVADGIFGALTKSAVVKWQRAHKIKADGEVGPTTWKAMQL